MTSSRFFFIISLFVATIVVLLPPVAYFAFERAYQNRVYPGVTVDTALLDRQNSTIVLKAAGEQIDVSWSVSAQDLGLAVDKSATQERLLSIGRSGNLREDLSTQFSAYRHGIEISPILMLDQARVDELVASVGATIDNSPIEPKFRLSGGRVTEFQQGAPGRAVDRDLLSQQLVASVLSNQNSDEIEIPISPVHPKANAGQTTAESLGIQELIGKGISRYKGSIPSRKHNVAITAARIDGTLIAPGETFSFNDTIGDVSQETGYQQAYIIQDGRTILGDGGGVCQDSTTLFRAVLNAGLPIVERHAHSYRVGYYEQNSAPGFDATVFAPTADFKFKNDTAASILIQAVADNTTNTLTIELWGAKDGRIATLTKPVVSDVTPPPEDLYQDDPTLPIGTVKQVDWKAAGAKVTFIYTVTKQGENPIKKTFVSLYRPWQSVYLRGTGG